MADNSNAEPEVAVAPKPQEQDSKPEITPELAKTLRTIKIKTGTVKRLTKDKVCYLKEAEEQEKKIRKFKEEGREELFIKQQEGNLKETQMMLPDIARLITDAYSSLKTLVNAEKDNVGFSEEYKAAVQALQEAEPHLVRTLNSGLMEG